jgi:hypothetical protein
MVTDMGRVMNSTVSRSGTETGPRRDAVFLSHRLKGSAGNDLV